MLSRSVARKSNPGLHERGALEHVRWQVDLGAVFDEPAFADALAGFRRLYGVAPLRVLCAPDVLQRAAALFARSGDDALARNLRVDGIPLVGSIVAPGTIVFEGEVDEERMGDW
jgi:hypothetical protein